MGRTSSAGAAPTPCWVAEGQPLAHVARLLHTAPHRIRAWRMHLLARGRAGLVDAPRLGQPPKLSPAALALLEEALTKSPQAYGFLSTVWTVRALGALLAYRHGVQVYTTAVHRPCWHRAIATVGRGMT
jgi:hypothetical protein